MGRSEKLMERLKQRPKDFPWGELTSLLKSLGYMQRRTGKTGGSRRRFDPLHGSHHYIAHPDRIVKRYVINDILELLKREGMI